MALFVIPVTQSVIWTRCERCFIEAKRWHTNCPVPQTMRFQSPTRFPAFVCAVSVIATLLCGATFSQSSNEPLTPRESSRFLAQATLGADWEEIHRASLLGLDGWFEEQFELPVGYHEPMLQDLVNVGAYASGANVEFDVAVKMKPAIDEFLQQLIAERSDFKNMRGRLLALAGQ